MKGYGTDDNSPASIIQGQLAITAQLNKAIAAMRDIDELFQWLAYSIVHTFDIQVAQGWTLQATHTAQYIAHLHCMVRQDTSIPQHILVNERIVAMVDQLSSLPYNFLQVEVEQLCVPYQATLFKRYGIHYCTWYFHNSHVLLAPVRQTPAEQDISGPLVIALLFLTRQAKSKDMLSSINRILEQAVQSASAHGLFRPSLEPSIPASFTELHSKQPVQENQPVSLPPPLPQQAPPSADAALAGQQAAQVTQAARSPLSIPRPTQLDLAQLIPRPFETAPVAEVSSLLHHTPVIADKHARRLYEVIDGKRTLKAIQVMIHMDWHNLYRAVRFLLIQRRIQLHEPDGQLVDSEQFLKGQDEKT